MSTAPSGDSRLASLLDLFDHIDLAVVTIDENRKVATCLVGAKMLGFTSQSIIGIDAGELVCPQTRQALLDACQHLQAGGKQSFGFERYDDDGHRREMSGTLHRQLGDSQTLWFVVCDVTHSRTHPPVESVSEKMSALRDLSGSVSHHMNNVIGGALTSIDFALDSQDEQRMKKTLIQASQLMVKAGSIIGGLQIFAVGDQHSQDLRGISDIIDDAIGSMAEDFSASGVLVKNEVPTRIKEEAGSQQLTTVLRILIKNAIEATSRDSAVRISASEEMPWVVLHVIDEGCGIAPKSLPHVFEPFWTTKEQFTTTAGEGTGLGLAMAHGIVTSIGGKIEIASKMNLGTQATVYWPIIGGVDEGE